MHARGSPEAAVALLLVNSILIQRVSSFYQPVPCLQCLTRQTNLQMTRHAETHRTKRSSTFNLLLATASIHMNKCLTLSRVREQNGAERMEVLEAVYVRDLNHTQPFICKKGKALTQRSRVNLRRQESMKRCIKNRILKDGCATLFRGRPVVKRDKALQLSSTGLVRAILTGSPRSPAPMIGPICSAKLSGVASK